MTTVHPSTAAADTRQGAAGRLLFIDNLRVWLIALVVLHHLAMIFGDAGPWYYVVPQTTETANVVALLFMLFNQAYFMGLFFALSGYFAPGSLDRKGAGPFLRERLLRLGVPLAVYFFVLAPNASLPAQLRSGEPYTVARYLEGLGFGPLWFIEMLLVFTVVYVVLRRGRGAPVSEARVPRGGAVVLATLALGVATYLFRVWVPFGSYIPWVDLPSFFELPQYVLFFAAGVLAYRRGWLSTLPSRFGVVGGLAALGATIVLLPLAILSPEQMVQPGSWQSAALAFWEAIFAVGFSLALLVFFRRFFGRQNALGRELSRDAFAVFLIHAPVITLVAVSLEPLRLDPFAGFGLAALVSVPLSFGLGAILRRMPGARRIL